MLESAPNFLLTDDKKALDSFAIPIKVFLLEKVCFTGVKFYGKESSVIFKYSYLAKETGVINEGGQKSFKNPINGDLNKLVGI